MISLAEHLKKKKYKYIQRSQKVLQFLTSFMYSSHFVYMLSTYFLCSWYGILSFKTPIDIDFEKIKIISFIFLTASELMRPFSVSYKKVKKNHSFFSLFQFLVSHSSTIFQNGLS